MSKAFNRIVDEYVNVNCPHDDAWTRMKVRGAFLAGADQGRANRETFPKCSADDVCLKIKAKYHKRFDAIIDSHQEGKDPWPVFQALQLTLREAIEEAYRESPSVVERETASPTTMSVTDATETPELAEAAKRCEMNYDSSDSHMKQTVRFHRYWAFIHGANWHKALTLLTESEGSNE